MFRGPVPFVVDPVVEKEHELMDEETKRYKVVVNHEEQYSLWFVDREIPAGWRSAGKEGSKEECLAYVEEVWTDMRPLSLRKRMNEVG